MIKSIQHFNEKSVPFFERLEDEFLRDPSDIASYITKLTEELHKTGLRMIEETLEYLDQMINESEARKLSWVVDRHETKQLITSLGSVNYSKTLFKDKIEEEVLGGKRHKLINPHYFCSDSASEDNKEFWERIYAYIDSHYDVGQLEKIYVNGDGGSWMEEGKKGIAGVVVTMDEFHLQKYLIKITSHLKDSRLEAISELRKIIMHKNKKEFNEYVNFVKSFVKEEDRKRAERMEEGRNYILKNWMPCKVRLCYRKKLPGCSAEGHVSHVLASRMTSRPMGWSKRGAGQMGRLRAYYYNGGDMLELVRFQRQELKKTVGYEMSYCSVPEIMRAEKNRHYELGKYMNSMRGSLSSDMKKRLKIEHHIRGL